MDRQTQINIILQEIDEAFGIPRRREDDNTVFINGIAAGLERIEKEGGFCCDGHTGAGTNHS